MAKGKRDWRLSALKVPARVPLSLYPELAVVLATPGFHLEHWASAFRWPRDAKYLAWAGQVRSTADPELVDLNARSMTLEDGLDWLRAILWTRPNYGGSVPY